MDASYPGETLRHLQKQNELLMDTYRSVSHELHKLQVEEEMLMRKFYELMPAQGSSEKKGRIDVVEEIKHGKSKARISSHT